MKKICLKITSLFCAVLVSFCTIITSYALPAFMGALGEAILGWVVGKGLETVFSLFSKDDLTLTEQIDGISYLVSFFDYNPQYDPESKEFLELVDFCSYDTYYYYALNDDELQSQGVTQSTQPEVDEFLKEHFGENYINIYDTLSPLICQVCNIPDRISTYSPYCVTYTPEQLVDIIKRKLCFRTEDDKPAMSSEGFKELYVEPANKTIDPKNPTMLKYSWAEYVEKNGVSKSDNSSYNQLGQYLYQDQQTIFGGSRSDGLYFQFYGVDDNGNTYYSPYQYHYYEKRDYQQVAPTTNVMIYTWYMHVIYYETLNGKSLDEFTTPVNRYKDKYDSNNGTIERADFKYINFGGDYDDFNLFGYNSMLGAKDKLTSDSVKGYTSQRGSQTQIPLARYSTAPASSYTNDLLTAEELNFSSSYGSAGEVALRSYDLNKNTRGLDFYDYYSNKYWVDLGFYVSPEPFSTTYLIDTTKIPSNTTVTMSGDTVYDYSITDNSTGDSTTIGEYVENNYTFNGDINQGGSGGTGGSGGSVNGNITVGGQVDVGGSVDVNVDVNINGSLGGVAGGAGSAGGSDDLDKWVTSDTSGQIAEYLGQIPELPKTFIDYIKDFFAWLPKEILGLIGLGFVAIVVKLILRR